MPQVSMLFKIISQKLNILKTAATISPNIARNPSSNEVFNQQPLNRLTDLEAKMPERKIHSYYGGNLFTSGVKIRQYKKPLYVIRAVLHTITLFKSNFIL